MRFWIAFVLLLAFSQTSFAAPKSHTDDIAEAVIRSQVGQNIRPGASSYFVSVGDADISDSLIARLHDTRVTFRRASEFPKTPIEDHVSKTWIINIQTPKRRADGDFDVPWSYYCGTLCRAAMTAVVHHDKHGWRVVRSKIDMIS